MREDYLEKLEKMFPTGFLIMYPVKNDTELRLSIVAEKNTDACKELIAAKKVLEQAAREN